MKRFLKFILIFHCLFATAQTRLEKRVYYLDCSQTMLNNDLWNRVKNNLKEAINKIDDSNTEVEVVLFAYDLSHNTDTKINRECKQISSSEGKRLLVKFIDEIPAPTRGKENTYTFHDVPLIDFCNYRIDLDKDNYFYLMTDGLDEYGRKGPKVSTKSFDEYIKANWRQVTKDKNVFGFYVMLSGNDNKRFELCKNTSYLWYMETADVNVNTIRASVENSPAYPTPIKIKLSGKKNLNHVTPSISGSNPYYNLSKSDYKDGIITLIPSIRPGIEAKEIPLSVESKVLLSTPQGPFEGKQFNIIVDEELCVDIKCIKNPIALDAKKIYNVRSSNYFELTPTRGNLSQVDNINVRFEDSLNICAKTKITDNKVIVYPILKEGIDSTYYINKFLKSSTQKFKLFYSIKSKDSFTYVDGANSVIVTFEGKWEKWLTTSIEACDKSKSLFTTISSWISSENESSLGTITYYPDFLWKKENTTKSQAKWYLTFTKDALGIAGTTVQLEFCDKSGNPLDTSLYKIYVNNKLCEGNKFEVTNKMTQLDVRAWMKPGTSSHRWWGTDEFDGNLKVTTYNNLIGINDYTIKEGTLVLPWTVVYEKELNPVLFWLIVIIASIVLAYISWRLACCMHRFSMTKFPFTGQIDFDPSIRVLNNNLDVVVDNMTIATHGSVNIFLNNLHKTAIKEIIISAQTQTHNTYTHWNGYTPYICATLSSSISEIRIKPKRGHLAHIRVIQNNGNDLEMIIDYPNHYNIGNTNNYIIAHS